MENLYLQEQGKSAENSYGRAEKDTICQRNNAQGGLGATPGCVEVSVCQPSNVQGGLSIGGGQVANKLGSTA